jgi:hypothetical protein
MMIAQCVWSRSLAVAMVLLAGGTVVAERTVLLGSRDATLVESATGALADGAGPHFRAGRTNQVTGSIRRGLLAFEVAKRLPRGSTITAVTLLLDMTATSGGNSEITLHRVVRSWGEGPAATSSGQGAPASDGDVTWIHRFWDHVDWRASGSDFVTEPSAATTVGAEGCYTWSGDGLVRDVQLWLDEPWQAHGWAVIGDEGASQTVKRFDSREVPAPGIPPLLIVDFVRTTGEDEEDLDDETDAPGGPAGSRRFGAGR